MDTAQFVDSELMAAVIGACSGLGGYYLGEHLQRRVRREERRARVFSLLRVAHHELEFQASQLKAVEEHLLAIDFELCNHGRNIALPSSPILPGFLGTLRDEIVTLTSDDNFISQLGRCHFELCHIDGRLELLRAQVDAAGSDDYETLVMNTRAVLALVQETRIYCKSAAASAADQTQRLH